MSGDVHIISGIFASVESSLSISIYPLLCLYILKVKNLFLPFCSLPPVSKLGCLIIISGDSPTANSKLFLTRSIEVILPVLIVE